MGNDENVAQIKSKTDALLSEYKRIYKRLAEIFTTEKSGKEIDKSTFIEMLGRLKDAVEDFDLDNADSIIAELDNCIIPSEFYDNYNELKVYVSEVDQDNILRKINEMEK